MSLTALVVGDLICELHYTIATPANTQHTDVLLGGAAATAQLAQALGCRVFLAGLTGADEYAKTLETLISAAGVTACISKLLPTTNVVVGDSIPMTQRRYNANTGEILTSLYQLPVNLLSEIGVIVIADYAYGGVTAPLVSAMKQLSTMYNIPVIVTTTTADSPALRQDFNLLISDVDVAEKLLAAVVHPALCVECSPDDRRYVMCQLLQRQLYAKEVVLVDARAVYFTDPDDNHRVHAVNTHEGCRVPSQKQIALAASAMAAAYCRKESLSAAAAFLTHVLAVADKGGEVTADNVGAHAYIAGGWSAKLCDKHSAKLLVDRWRRMHHGCRIVLVTGIFDGLTHLDIEALRYAARQGECVVVAMDSDAHIVAANADVVVPESFRMTHLAMLPDVDAVFTTAESDIELVRHFKPEVYMPIGCSMANMGQGADYVAAHGGRVEFAPQRPYTV